MNSTKDQKDPPYKLPFTERQLPGVDLNVLKDSFQCLDLDDNGHIGVVELRHWLTVLGERPADEEIDEMISMIDEDGIGQVGLDEWLRLFNSVPLINEMRNVKIASDKMKKELESLAKAGVEDVAESLVAREAKNKQVIEKIAKTKQKEMVSVERNYNVLRHFAVAPDQLKKYYERFVNIDRDGSGSITYHEFCLVLEEFDSEQMRSLFQIFDGDSSGTIDLIEFIVGLSAYCVSASKEDRLKFAFLICDSENTGFLDADEIARIVRSNFLAQQSSQSDIKRRVDKIFRLAGAKNVISFKKFMDVSKRVPGLIYPAYVMLESTAI